MILRLISRSYHTPFSEKGKFLNPSFSMQNLVIFSKSIFSRLAYGFCNRLFTLAGKTDCNVVGFVAVACGLCPLSIKAIFYQK